MITEMKVAVNVTETEAQYDEKAKRLLGEKIILAHILVKTVEEFSGMKPEDVVCLIEGEPYISCVPVEPGATNKAAGNGTRIVSFNTENAEIMEGLIRFDIVFYVRMKDGLTQMIINIEAQKDEPTTYKIMNRAQFYVCRLVSSQKERDFTNTNYDDIKRVYSIWICMNMEKNTLNHFYMVDDCLLGDYDWPGTKDLLNVIMIGLAKEIPEQDEAYELHRLLGVLLSNEITSTKKLNIMKEEYQIPVEEDIREDVISMCNLSQKIKEESLEQGLSQGLSQGLKRGEIIGFVNALRKLMKSDEEINQYIMSEYSLTKEEAKEYVTK